VYGRVPVFPQRHCERGARRDALQDSHRARQPVLSQVRQAAQPMARRKLDKACGRRELSALPGIATPPASCRHRGGRGKRRRLVGGTALTMRGHHYGIRGLA